MNETKTLNNLHLPSTTKKVGSPHDDFQERLLVHLSEPPQNRTRFRNSLSKFTIASSSHPSSCENPIPAYRTFAHESLPVVTPEDNKKLNISPVSGMPYYISPHAITEGQGRSNSSKNDLKTRRCLLQKKTMHLSLEDLRNNSRKESHPFDDLPSTRPRTSIPSNSLDSHSSKWAAGFKQRNNGNRKLTRALPASFPSQQKTLNSDTQLDNMITSAEEDTRINSVCGPGGDCCASSPSESSNEEVAERNLRNLSIENELLKKQIKMERRKCIFYKIVNAFALEGLRRRSHLLAQVEHTLLRRREECAARIILHHLLLNSWRMTKGQAGAIMVENTQMHKTIDNQSLQLNVIRKMQSIEKEKTTSVLKDYNEVKRNYCQTVKENESIKEEYAKVLEEKRSLEQHLRTLSAENCRLNTDLQIRLDKKEMQLRSMELDRFRADKFSKENEQLMRETELVKTQVKELTSQQAHWQEKALSYESKCYELKLEMESKEKAYERALCEKVDISKENEILTLSKSKLEKAVEEAHTKLVESTSQKKLLEKSYNECKEELEDLEDQVQYLQTTLRQYKKENVEIRQKLYDCTLKNVKRRRVWGAALYFLVNPIEAFKRLYFGPSAEIRPSRIVATLPAGKNAEKVPEEKMSES